MSPCPTCIDSDQPLIEAHRLMRQKRARHLPVLSGGRLVGVVSVGDLYLLEGVEGIEQEKVRVRQAMTPEPYRVPADAPLDEVVDVMAGNKYGCAIVMDGERVAGIFTTVDALEVLARVLRGEIQWSAASRGRSSGSAESEAPPRGA
jgi:acetoin utilization protein AcuB